MRARWMPLVAFYLALAVVFPLSADAGRIARLHGPAVQFAAPPVPVGDLHYDEGFTGTAAPADAPGAALLVAGDPITSTNISQLLSKSAPRGTGTIYDRIRGNASFVRRVRLALDWLQAHDPEAFQRVETYVTVIAPSPYARLAQAVPMTDGTCTVKALARRAMSVEMIAALLYHEASHCYQFATAGVLSSKEAEVYAYTEQIAFMERNGFPQDVLDYYRRVLDYYAGQPDDGQHIPPPDF